MNLTATYLAIQGYVDAQKAKGAHPSTAIAIPFTLAEWEALAKAPLPEGREPRPNMTCWDRKDPLEVRIGFRTQEEAWAYQKLMSRHVSGPQDDAGSRK